MQDVCDAILRAQGVKNVNVRRNISLVGQSGCKHQIDIYWEFMIDEEKYRVAIECKAFNKKVGIGSVRNFHAALKDIGNINGIFATLVGYQAGAKKYGAHYNISLKELRKPNDTDWKNRLRDANVNIEITTPYIDDFLPILTEDFVSKNLDKGSFSGEISSNDVIIFDKIREPLYTASQLSKKLPTDGAPFEGHEFTFEFPGHYFKVGDAFLEIDALKIKYSTRVQMDNFKIYGDDLIKSIIKDALSESCAFVSVLGDLR